MTNVVIFNPSTFVFGIKIGTPVKPVFETIKAMAKGYEKDLLITIVPVESCRIVEDEVGNQELIDDVPFIIVKDTDEVRAKDIALTLYHCLEVNVEIQKLKGFFV